MSAHTPGPWFQTTITMEGVPTYGSAPSRPIRARRPDGSEVQVCDAGSSVRGSGPTSAANARLIAAAPDLLAALAALREAAAKNVVSIYELNAADAAIAKAVGK